MQDFIEQARKHNVRLFETGECQFCGSKVSRGVFECMDIYNNNVLSFDYNLPRTSQTRFLMVDAHALQHSELHGKWNNHFHLTRLCLMLDKRVIWDYKLSPKLSNFFLEYKRDNPNEIISAPPVLERGRISAKDISLTDMKDYEESISSWANAVYAAWHAHHDLVLGIANRFMAGIKK